MRTASAYRAVTAAFAISLTLWGCTKAHTDSFAVMPVESVRFREGRGSMFYSAFVSSLIEHGHSVVDIGNIHRILRAQELNLSEAVGDSTKRREVGNILQVKYLLSASFVWNGEYTLATISVDDVSLGTVVFQKYYTTDRSAEAIAAEGIREIVAHIHGKTTSTTVWDVQADYVQTDFASRIVTWARSRRASRICLLYAGSSSIKLLVDGSKYTDSLKAEVLKTYDELAKSGEYVFQYHLGSYELALDYKSRSVELKYQIKRTLTMFLNYDITNFLLRDANTVVVFFGTGEEASLAMNELSREQRTRFWHAMIWK